ncbi:MAG: hypothetical protein MUP69_08275 [Candidatus Atribacteria bacterium]|nr:hypothetical protein [Candidatus Atribacteria bacterium]
MEDIDRTKEQLINELIKLPKKIAKLESAKISHKLTEKQLVKSEADKRMYQDKLLEKYPLDSF